MNENPLQGFHSNFERDKSLSRIFFFASTYRGWSERMQISLALQQARFNFAAAGATHKNTADLLGLSLPSLKAIFAGRLSIDSGTEEAYRAISVRCLKFARALQPLCLIDWTMMKQLLEREDDTSPEQIAELVAAIFSKRLET